MPTGVPKNMNKSAYETDDGAMAYHVTRNSKLSTAFFILSFRRSFNFGLCLSSYSRNRSQPLRLQSTFSCPVLCRSLLLELYPGRIHLQTEVVVDRVVLVFSLIQDRKDLHLQT